MVPVPRFLLQSLPIPSPLLWIPTTAQYQNRNPCCFVSIGPLLLTVRLAQCPFKKVPVKLVVAFLVLVHPAQSVPNQTSALHSSGSFPVSGAVFLHVSQLLRVGLAAVLTHSSMQWTNLIELSISSLFCCLHSTSDSICKFHSSAE